MSTASLPLIHYSRIRLTGRLHGGAIRVVVASGERLRMARVSVLSIMLPSAKSNGGPYGNLR